ncbi:MATE family efflux transporter [Oscillospiraceae bacterium OttesenSCG-928-F05]|nr:MATE family efflux transporter [Oscillospiraceae bacterium OttesenSCG-928-F05]
MTKGSPIWTILLFAIPLFLSQILQMTYNMVDSIIVGRFVGESELAAVAVTHTPVTLFNAILVGFSVAATIIVSQYFGAKQFDQMKRTFSTTYIYTAVGGVLTTGLVFLAARPLLRVVLSTPEGILDGATGYLQVYYTGAIFVFFYNLLTGLMRAIGDSVRPLIFLVVSCLLNILLDLVFVLGFNWGINGAAAATVVSQAVAVVGILIYIKRKHPIMWVPFREFVFDGEIFGHSIKLGVPEALQQGIMSICFMWQQKLINGFGETTIAAFLAGQRVDQLVGIPVIVMGSAMATFAGQNIGAGKIERIYEARKKLILVMFGVIAVLGPLLLLFGRPILSLFVENPESEVIVQAYQYLWTIVPFFFFLAYSSITGGAMRGAGDSRFAMITSFVSLGARIVAAYVLLACGLGYIGVFLATGVSFVINCAPALMRFRSGRWKDKAIVKQTSA